MSEEKRKESETVKEKELEIVTVIMPDNEVINQGNVRVSSEESKTALLKVTKSRLEVAFEIFVKNPCNGYEVLEQSMLAYQRVYQFDVPLDF